MQKNTSLQLKVKLKLQEDCRNPKCDSSFERLTFEQVKNANLDRYLREYGTQRAEFMRAL